MTDIARMNSLLGSRDALSLAADTANTLGTYLFQVGTGHRRPDPAFERQLRDELRAEVPDAAAAIALLKFAAGE